MIDLHCHLLPGVDDGPEDLDAAVALCAAMAATGTTVAVATPHVDHTWGVAPLEVAGRLDALRAALEAESVELEVLAGGELSLPRYVELGDEELDAVRLGGGPYLLLECPHSPMAGDFDVAVARLAERGEAILLAHPERCPLFHQNPARLAPLVDAGVLCSVTAGSFAGRFGRRTADLARRLLRDELIHDVASDAHDARRRPPGLDLGFADTNRELLGIAGLAGWLTCEVPAAILSGAELPARPALPPSPPRRRLGMVSWPRRG